MVMTLLKWRDDYSIGAASVDDEHKALIERINRLDDQLMAKDGPLATATFFEDLIETINAHVLREERYMCEHGYDQLPQHREDYERFLDETHGLVDEFDRNKEADREELATRLDGWLSAHFETHDVRIAKAFEPHSG